MKHFRLLILLVALTSWLTADAQDPLNEGDDFGEATELEEDLGARPQPPPPAPGNNAPGSFTPSDTFNPSGGAKNPNPSFNSGKRRARPPLSQANVEDITNENYPELIESFDFPNAEIADVVKAISELTGKNFIIDPSIRGKITIIAPTQITVAEAYKAFLSALAINNFSVVPAGKFLKILPARNALKDNIEIYQGAYTPNTDQMITRIVHLRHIPASEFNKFANNLKSNSGTIDVYEPTNTLIISDFGTNVTRIQKILAQLDTPGFEEQLTVIPIRHAKAKDIADLIDQIINKGQKNQRNQFGGGISRFRTGADTSGGAGATALSLVLPDERTNSIIVVGNKAGTEKIKGLVRTLDYTKDDMGGGAYVYYVKYGEAEKIANTLNGIAKQVQEAEKQGGRTGSPSLGGIEPAPIDGGFGAPNQRQQNQSSGGTAMFGGDVKITADKDTNSLIIIANRQDYRSVLSMLNKLDIPRDQVFVETMIMELVAGNNDAFGVNYFKFLNPPDSTARAGFTGSNVNDLLNVAGTSGLLLGFASGAKVKIKTAAGDVEVKDTLGFINVLKGNNNVNVLSTPQVIAMDNEEATIEVGETIPVGTETTTGTAGTSTQSIKFAEAKIKLKITPFISPKTESVRMKIEQTVKQQSSRQVQAKNLADSSVVTSDRGLTTNIVVPDGDTAVLGGLMTDQEEYSVTKVPILGDIPLLGWLFKSTQKKLNKVNLLLFITPKVIRNRGDSDLLLGQKLDDRLKFIKDNFGGRDKHGALFETMDPRVGLAPAQKTEATKTEKQKDEELLEDLDEQDELEE